MRAAIEHRVLSALRARLPSALAGRVALAFANRALERPGSQQASRALAALDVLIAGTLAEERQHGQRYFLLPYVDDAPFVAAAGRSLFVDPDGDSGPVVPLFDLNAGASGLAFVGAGAFGDRPLDLAPQPALRQPVRDHRVGDLIGGGEAHAVGRADRETAELERAH